MMHVVMHITQKSVLRGIQRKQWNGKRQQYANFVLLYFLRCETGRGQPKPTSYTSTSAYIQGQHVAASTQAGNPSICRGVAS